MKRFKRKYPCPICGGFDEQGRGKSRRCYGFLSDSEEWAHCTREELAGSLAKNSQSDTYAHLLFGKCNCGDTHNPKTEPEPRGLLTNSNSRKAATYDYEDENSQLLYQVCRTPPKRFFQRRPNGNGGWIDSLGDVRRVLYRLPELVSAEESKTVFICEGEKDCDALRNLGLLATTNAGGAKKWKDEFSETLRGRDVVILPDNDDIGKQHAEQVANSLKNIAANVRILELSGLPQAGDVTDWLNAGGSVQKLLELAATCSKWDVPLLPKEQACSTEDWISVADVEAKDVEWLWHPYIPLGKLTMFDGDPGIGKSFCTCAIAAAVSRGIGLPNMASRPPASVLMLSGEDGFSDTIRPRLEGLGGV